MKLAPSWLPKRRPAPPDPLPGLVLARLDQIESSVLAISTLLSNLNAKVNSVMATLADIQTAETEEATAISGIVAKITQLETDLAAAQAGGSDPAAIQAIVDQIHANTARLTAALPPASTPPAA
jgi:hypothetical protein